MGPTGTPLATVSRVTDAEQPGIPSDVVAPTARPFVVGLTGGTGVGKSTVCGLLAERGALVIDCDQLGRDVVAPGGPALEPIFERFGDGMRTPEGQLDRAALAAVVFNDPAALEALNAITHPAIDQLIARRIASAEADVIVLDMAVLVESNLGKGQYEAVIVVEAAIDLRLDRLEARGMSRDDARARMASQANDAERREIADLVVTNNGDLTELRDAVAQLWESLQVLIRRRRSS